MTVGGDKNGGHFLLAGSDEAVAKIGPQSVNYQSSPMIITLPSLLEWLRCSKLKVEGGKVAFKAKHQDSTREKKQRNS